jgi:hypothetical protein
MDQTSNDPASRLANLDSSNHAPEEILGQPESSRYASSAERRRGDNVPSRANSDCVPSVQAALSAFRQSISLLDA